MKTVASHVPEEEELTAVSIIIPKDKADKTSFSKAKQAEQEDHRDQEIIIYLQFISKVTITTCTYKYYFPFLLRALCYIPLCT